MKSFYSEYQKNGKKNLDTLVTISLNWVEVKQLLNSKHGLKAFQGKMMQVLKEKNLSTNYD